MKVLTRFLLLLALLAASSNGVSAQDERTLFFPRSAEYVECMPPAERVWLFVLAGQSNMAGRGLVEPSDTVPHPRILSVTPDKRWVMAKEPLQLYQPALTGLGPGMAFARALLGEIDEDICIGLIPCAVGGSSTTDWLTDSIYNGVRLKSNMTEKVRWAMEYGTVKGIIWHQGESDANPEKIPHYRENTEALFDCFRSVAGDAELPIVAGELGIFPGVEKKRLEYLQINDILSSISEEDPNTILVRSFGTKPKADNVHFDGPSQRAMGRRYALAWLSLVRSQNR
jgi:hypothetical protein